MVVFLAADRLEFDDVAGPEEHHEVAQIAGLLLGIEDRHRRDAEHLVAAGAAYGIDAAEAATIADGELWRIRTRAQIFRHLDLPRPLDHLVHERQAGDETDHRHEPRRAGMRGDEIVDRSVIVDPRRVFEIGRFGILVALAKAHQCLMRPRILVVGRNFDDARADHRLRLRRRILDRLHFAQHVVRLDDIRIELDLERRVGRADLGDALDLAVADRLGHRQALEEGLQRHLSSHSTNRCSSPPNE